MKTAKQVAESVGNVSFDSACEIHTRFVSGDIEILRICGVGEDAFFEWITGDGDPVGDVFYEIEIPSELLP